MQLITANLRVKGSRQLIVYTINKFSTDVPNSKILKTDFLSRHALEQLICHETIDALVIPNFCSKSLCEKLSSYFLESNQIEKYDHDIYNPEDQAMKTVYAGVDRVGIPYNKVFSHLNEEERSVIREQYYEAGTKSMKKLRKVCENYISPVDRLRIGLEDYFPSGARVARFEGRQMFCGIGRISDPLLSVGGEQPNFDMLPEDVYPLEKQFAANIYIKAPSDGGALQVIIFLI